jgi:hypothetical protein
MGKCVNAFWGNSSILYVLHEKTLRQKTVLSLTLLLNSIHFFCANNYSAGIFFEKNGWSRQRGDSFWITEFCSNLRPRPPVLRSYADIQSTVCQNADKVNIFSPTVFIVVAPT